MKLSKGMVGMPVPPDYDMLRAALIAAQSSTPTARASIAIHSRGEELAALHELLTTAHSASADAAALGNCFARHTPDADETGGGKA